MNIKIMIFVATIFFIKGEAALPPLYQSAADIRAIVTDEQFGKKFHSGEVIEKIERNEKGYEVTTNQHKVQVNVEYEQLRGPGPARIKLHFQD